MARDKMTVVSRLIFTITTIIKKNNGTMVPLRENQKLNSLFTIVKTSHNYYTGFLTFSHIVRTVSFFLRKHTRIYLNKTEVSAQNK